MDASAKDSHYVECSREDQERYATKLTEAATGENEVEDMRKDFHLLEAALATDQTIISLDETVRGCFAPCHSTCW